MGFYQTQPWNTATAVFIQSPDSFGTFLVDVDGDAMEFTSGIQLVRDPDFVGGLKVTVKGWTGPLTGKTFPYKAHGSFDGQYRDQIVVSGSNKTELVNVEIIPPEKAEEHLRARAEAA